MNDMPDFFKDIFGDFSEKHGTFSELIGDEIYCRNQCTINPKHRRDETCKKIIENHGWCPYRIGGVR